MTGSHVPAPRAPMTRPERQSFTKLAVENQVHEEVHGGVEEPQAGHPDPSRSGQLHADVMHDVDDHVRRPADEEHPEDDHRCLQGDEF